MPRPPCIGKTVVKKGPWTPEEDEVLVEYVEKYGCGNWRTLPKMAGLNRCGKSCRLRWTNYLRPEIKRGGISPQEEETIISLHKVLGNKHFIMVEFFPHQHCYFKICVHPLMRIHGRECGSLERHSKQWWSKIAAQLPGRTDNEIKNFWNTHLRKKLLRCGIDPLTHTPVTDQNVLKNPSFNLHANATQLAKMQLLQNILETVSLIQLQFYGNNFHLGGPLNQESVLNSRIYTSLGPSYIAPRERELLNQDNYLDPIVYAPLDLIEQLHYNHAQDLVHPNKFVRDANSIHEKRLLQPQGTLANLDNINVHVMRTAKSFKGFNSSEGFVPSLVLVNPTENSIVKQHAYENISQGVSTEEIESMIDSWEKFLDDEASTSFLKDILA